MLSPSSLTDLGRVTIYPTIRSGGGLASRAGRPVGTLGRPGPPGAGLSRLDLRFPSDASIGFTVFTYIGSGVLTFASSAAIVKEKIDAVSGGFVFASTAPRLKLKVGAVSGGAVFAGAATTTLQSTHIYLPTGGLLLAGAGVTIPPVIVGVVTGYLPTWRPRRFR